MTLLTPDDVTDEELLTLEGFLWTFPDGELREALAYLHDALVQGNSVVVGAIEETS